MHHKYPGILMKRIYLLFAVFLFIAGCASYVRDYSRIYESGLNRDPRAIFDYTQFTTFEPFKCQCFVCEPKQSSFFSFFTSLKGGSCRLETNCSQETFSAINSQDGTGRGERTGTGLGWTIRQFMIGQGATFADFGPANQYCGDRLDMSVRWLVAKPYRDAATGTMRVTKYPLPQKSRATCFLDIGVMPVYILYSEGKGVDPERAAEIATELRDAGPVIITSEIDFDSSDSAIVENVKSQVKSMKLACPTCLIAVAPRMNDTAGLDRVFSDQEARRSTDLVAFGINTRYSRLDCSNPANQALRDNPVDAVYYYNALNFSQYIRNKYQKPSIIPYVLFEINQPWGYANTCPPLSEQDVFDPANPDNAHSKFFANYLVQFLNSGTIGIAPYKFSRGGDDPLHCTDCSLSKTESRLQSWFGWCQKHKLATRVLPNELSPSGELLAVYPNASSGYCDFGQNFQLYAKAFYPDRDFSLTPNVTMDPPQRVRVTCDACVNQEGTDFPFDVGPRAGGAQPDWCTRWDSDISANADPLDIDPMIVRAIIWQESNGLRDAEDYVSTRAENRGRCAVSAVSSGDSCYSYAYDYVEDPDNVCPPAGTQISAGGAPASTRLCAFGIMQTLDSSYTYWGPIDDPRVSQAISASAYNIRTGVLTGRPRETRDIAQQCTSDGRFNPFNPSHNICDGVNKFSIYLTAGTAKARQNAVSLNAVNADGSINTTKVTFLGYYFGLHNYYGSGGDSTYGGIDNWVRVFAAQKTHGPGECAAREDGRFICPGIDWPVTLDCKNNAYGNTVAGGDPVKFIRKCVFESHETRRAGGIFEPASDYGSQVLAKYLALVGTRNSPGVCMNTGCNKGVVYEVGGS